MLRNAGIFRKLFLSHLTIGVVSVISLSVIFYLLFQRALINRTVDQLSSINILKKTQIDNYFGEIGKDIRFELNREKTRRWFERSFVSDSLVTMGLQALDRKYDTKACLVLDGQGNTVAVSRTDSTLVRYAKIVGQSLSSSGFTVFDASVALQSDSTELIYLIPVDDGQKRLGYIFLREDFKKIQNILQETTGMGATGESYLVGSDFKMRSRSRFFPQRPPLTLTVETASTKNAREAIFRGDIITDYRGVEVLSFSRKIAAPDWVIISEIDYSEAMEPIAEWRNVIVVTVLLIVLVILIVSYFMASSISKPILVFKGIISTLSKGMVPTEVIAPTYGGELGEIANAIRELIAGLKRTTQFADEIGAGNFGAHFITLGADDSLGIALLRMRDRLRFLSDEKIRLVREKTGALLEGQEQERKRIVRELHDGVGQLLTAIRLQVELLEKQKKPNEEIRSLVNETIDEVRRISFNLMPNSIVDFGLEAALKGLCDDIRKVANFTIDFNFVREFDHEISFEISIAVYRIIQEGFNNVMKHSKATHLDLYVLDNERQIYFLLKDNGVGFEKQSGHPAGFGLRTMEERAKLLHGSLEVYSSMGHGTELEGTIPLD